MTEIHDVDFVLTMDDCPCGRCGGQIIAIKPITEAARAWAAALTGEPTAALMTPEVDSAGRMVEQIEAAGLTVAPMMGETTN